jgi:hypothetical protein
MMQVLASAQKEISTRVEEARARHSQVRVKNSILLTFSTFVVERYPYLIEIFMIHVLSVTLALLLLRRL